jgi:hypothetical protein
MRQNTHLHEDFELNELRKAELELLLREQECANLPKKLAQEQRDRECMMPPLAEIEERILQRAHANMVSRGEVSNILREQNQSIVLLVSLAFSTAALIWWGLKLMQG